MAVIWLISLILALGSLLIVVALVIARSISERRAKRLQSFEDPVRHAFVAFSSRPDEQALLETLKGIDPAIVAYHCRNLLCLVRGEISEKLRVVLTELDIPRLEQQRLRHAELPARVRAADFLSYFGDRESADALRAALNDSAGEVCVAAAISLARRGETFDLLRVLKAFERGLFFSQRLLELFEALATNTVDHVLPIIGDEHLDARLRGLAIEGMCRTKAPNLIDMLKVLSDTSESACIVASVLRGAAMLGHPAVSNLITRHIDSDEPLIRLSAIEAIATLGIANDELIQKLIEQCASNDFVIRNVATSTLQKLGLSFHEIQQRKLSLQCDIRLLPVQSTRGG